jgi:hypothetical protein
VSLNAVEVFVSQKESFIRTTNKNAKSWRWFDSNVPLLKKVKK